MRHLLYSCLLVVLLPSIGLTQEGYTELGVSGSYKRSNLDAENYTETRSMTGSMSYYFWASSAIEISYTKGLTTVVTDPSRITGSTAKTEFQLLGADLVLSMGSRESRFRPYLKIGAVHVSSKIIIQNSQAVDTIEPEPGIAPSAGIGAKIILAKHFALKFSVESWTSPLSQDPVEFNYAGRAGISCIF